MRDEIPLSDAEIEGIFDSLHRAITAKDLRFTRETIEDFDKARMAWHAPGEEPARVRVMGLDTWTARDAQANVDVVVVDFGTVRAVYVPRG